MNIFRILFLLLLLLPLHAEDLAQRSQELLRENPEARAIEGRDGWLFLANEFRYLAKGSDWIAPEEAPTPPHQDPLPALRELKRQLSELNIALIMVPIPAKAAVYPEMLPGEPTPKVETTMPFVDQLQREDFQVVDLRTLFRGAKPDTQLYCKTDTHWSPRGAELAAAAISQLIENENLLTNVSPVKISTGDTSEIRIQGDLSGEGADPETLPAREVRRDDGGALVDKDSPILLLGDSHTLVFSEGGDMHTRNSGFLEHLAMQLQQPIDRVANRGSASTPPRMSVYRTAARDPQWLENKQVVIYLFTARELTESLNGWRVLPISPQFR